MCQPIRLLRAYNLYTISSNYIFSKYNRPLHEISLCTVKPVFETSCHLALHVTKQAANLRDHCSDTTLLHKSTQESDISDNRE